MCILFCPEQRLINDILRNPDPYRAMDDAARVKVWPRTKDLGGYSYALNDPEKRKLMWSLLLDKLTLDSCPNTQRQMH